MDPTSILPARKGLGQSVHQLEAELISVWTPDRSTELLNHDHCGTGVWLGAPTWANVIIGPIYWTLATVLLTLSYPLVIGVSVLLLTQRSRASHLNLHSNGVVLPNSLCRQRRRPIACGHNKSVVKHRGHWSCDVGSHHMFGRRTPSTYRRLKKHYVISTGSANPWVFPTSNF